PEVARASVGWWNTEEEVDGLVADIGALERSGPTRAQPADAEMVAG
ncbi:MAG: hypothetical protein H0W06_00795, partial [Chloroflexia bacterium]|nr:hypothetical protein [Chloroflexia bacterium]